MRLKDRVALITGGAAGIGLATAERFASEGARLALCDVDHARGQAVADRLGAEFRVVDVSNRDDVAAWVDAAEQHFGRVDILINNAGIVRDGQLVKYKDGEKVGELSQSDFDRVIAVNLKGPFNCGQTVVPAMVRAGGGVILNASSVVRDGNFGQTNYAATKAGVVAMTKTWARELARYNIRVNAVAPGFIATEMVKSMPEKVLAQLSARAPLARMGDPDDIANAYLFLASDEASFITGTVLRVDGGLVLGT